MNSRSAHDFVSLETAMQRPELLVEQLREARREVTRLKSVLRACPDCVVTFSQNGLIVGFNAVAESTFERRRDDVLGRDFSDLLVPPCEKVRYRELTAGLLAGHIAALGRRSDFIAQRADGEEFPCELMVTRTDIEGGAPFFTAFMRDLSERRRAERDLRESERRFRALFEQSPVSSQRFLPNGISVQTNSAFEALFGLTNDDLLRSGYNVLQDPQLERIGVAPLVRRAFDGEAVITPPLLYSPRQSTGLGRSEARWLRSHLYPIKENDGSIREVIVMHEDVTEQRDAEEALRELNRSLEARIAERTELLEQEIEERKLTEHALQTSEHRLLEILEAQVERVSRYTPEGINTYLNPAHVRLFGDREGSHVGENWIDLTEPTVAKMIREKIRALTPENPIFEAIHPRALPDGSEIWEHWVNRGIFDANGVLLEIQAAGRDITRLMKTEQALQESERKFRALFEGSQAGVVLLDHITILEINPSWVEMMGYSTRESFIGRSLLDFSAPLQGSGEPAAVVARRMAEERQAKGSARFEWVCIKADGTPFTLEVSSATITLGGRQIVQAVLQDITERKRAELEMIRALNRERELSRLKSSFISMVSHEYRNPLAIILSSTEILKKYHDRLSVEERLESLRDIETSTRRMTHMIDDLLFVGKAEAGKLTMSPAPLDLVEVCRKLVDEALGAQPDRAALHFRPEFIDEAAVSDEQILRLIFGNLLNNALKYSPADRPPTFAVRREGDNAIFVVKDEGIGVPETDRATLFQAFRRAKNAGTVPGTGLGLFIVKHCVDLHGGGLEFDSVEGRGTTVTVTLPLFSPPTPTSVPAVS